MGIVLIYLGFVALFIYALYNEYVTAREAAVLAVTFIALQILCFVKGLAILLVSWPVTLIYFVWKIYDGDVLIR